MLKQVHITFSSEVPGAGKTAIALFLLRELRSRNISVEIQTHLDKEVMIVSLDQRDREMLFDEARS